MTQKKPTAIKKLEGRKYGLNEREPKPLPMQLESLIPPNCLSKDAVTLWQDAAPRLIALGVLTEMDAPAFGAMCMSYGEMMQAYRTLQHKGGRTVTNSQGKSRSPAALTFDAEFRKFTTLLKEFGMTPASRSKVETALPQDDGSGKFEDLLD